MEALSRPVRLQVRSPHMLGDRSELSPVSDGERQKTTGTIQSRGPWDTLSVDIVGPLPADHRKEFLIVFVDCYSRYNILVPSSNHTSSTVSEALLRHVVPYFGTPRRLLSDRGREFVGNVWDKLMRSLGIQRVLTSPYHPEGNAINERSHRTLNNILRARLLEGTSSKAWVEKVPGIMLTLNAMSHEPHGFSASMVATGREPTLPPDVQHDAHASPSVNDPTDYVEVLAQRLKLTHQQMASPPPPAVVNPYQEGSLIYAMTTPPERSNKLTPRWKGPFRVRRIPNEYQVVYEDGAMWRTVHINHTKPAKFTVLTFQNPSQLLKLLVLPLDTCLQDFWDLDFVLLLLLLQQPHLPRVSLSLPQQQYPLRDPPRPPRARCLLPLPRQPISRQNPLSVHGDLPDSTLSLTGCVLSKAHPETSLLSLKNLPVWPRHTP